MGRRGPRLRPRRRPRPARPCGARRLVAPDARPAAPAGEPGRRSRLRHRHPGAAARRARPRGRRDRLLPRDGGARADQDRPRARRHRHRGRRLRPAPDPRRLRRRALAPRAVGDARPRRGAASLVGAAGPRGPARAGGGLLVAGRRHPRRADRAGGRDGAGRHRPQRHRAPAARPAAVGQAHRRRAVRGRQHRPDQPALTSSSRLGETGCAPLNSSKRQRPRVALRMPESWKRTRSESPSG